MIKDITELRTNYVCDILGIDFPASNLFRLFFGVGYTKCVSNQAFSKINEVLPDVDFTTKLILLEILTHTWNPLWKLNRIVSCGMSVFSITHSPYDSKKRGENVYKFNWTCDYASSVKMAIDAYKCGNIWVLYKGKIYKTISFS